MKISLNIEDNLTSKAKLSTYPKTINDKQIFVAFEERTKACPNLKLLQDNISFVDNDHFYLIEDGKARKFITASFTNNRAEYTTVDKIVDRFVEIFNKMIKK